MKVISESCEQLLSWVVAQIIDGFIYLFTYFLCERHGGGKRLKKWS